MSQCILVPTDFSSNANNAVKYAIGFAYATKAKLIFLHAFHVNYIATDVPMPYIAEQLEAVEKEAEAKLKELCATVTKEHGLTCDYINLNRLVSDLIAESVRLINPMLVIMGTKGAGRLKGFFMGTNTSRAIANASCPVLAIPQKVTYRPVKNVTYAANYELKDADNIRDIIKLLAPFKPQITVLHVCMDGYTDEVENADMNVLVDEVRAAVNYKALNFELIYGKYLEKALDAYVKRELPHMLVMSSHKRGLFARLFGPSDTRNRVYHTSIPLLCLHH